MVLGMHRSGTSCLAGSLQQQGLFLGEVHEWNPHNLKGNRENQRIMELNDAVMEENDGKWDSPPRINYWTPTQAKQRDQIIASLRKPNPTHWGFKDPRSLITLPFWEEALGSIQFIGTFRSPVAVAHSLHNRSGMPIQQGLSLWHEYNLRLLEQWDKNTFPLLCFDVAADQYKSDLEQAYGSLGISSVKIKQAPFFEQTLRSSPSQELTGDSMIGHACTALYQKLHSAYKYSAGLTP